MTRFPDLSTLTLPELKALDAALRAAIRAADAGGGGEDFDCALLADGEGVSVIFTIPVASAPGNPQA